jgi:hypothetical protein
VRGLQSLVSMLDPVRTIPACAGPIGPTSGIRRGSADHPRVRGADDPGLTHDYYLGVSWRILPPRPS